MRLNVSAVLLSIRIGNSDCDLNFLNRNLIHDAVLGVGRSADDVVGLVDDRVGDVGDGGNGRRDGRDGLDDLGDGGGVDVVHGHAAGSHGVCGRVRLRRNRRNGADGGRDGGLSSGCAGLEGVCVAGAVLDWDVSAETLCGALAVVRHEGLGHLLDFALALLELGLQGRGEDGAVFDAAGEVGAGVDGGLEGVNVPAVHEVGVVSVACGLLVKGYGQKQMVRLTGGVTVGPDHLAVLAVEGVGVPDGLVEERGQAHGEALGANTAIDHAGVSDVALVVRGRDVLAVPARGEEDFSADALGAVGVEVLLVGQEVAVARAFGLAGIVHAVEAERLLHQRLLGHVGGGPCGRGRVREFACEVTHARVSGNHLETLGEGLDVVSNKHVVCEHTTDLGNNLGLATCVDEVQRRCPMGINMIEGFL
jgi:hypothetical protein